MSDKDERNKVTNNDNSSDVKSPDEEENKLAEDISENEEEERDQESDVEKNDNIENIKSTENLLQEEIEQLRDEKLRLLAEMENLRKRTDRDRIDSVRYGSINLARDILSQDDNLTRALDTIPDEEKNSETVNNLIKGLKMVQKEFATILEKHGVKKINSLNNKFDHNFHQAMVEIEDNNVEAGTIVKEMQSGYTMHDRLLRPSMVAVSKKKNNDKDVAKD